VTAFQRALASVCACCLGARTVAQERVHARASPTQPGRGPDSCPETFCMYESSGILRHRPAAAAPRRRRSARQRRHSVLGSRRSATPPPGVRSGDSRALPASMLEWRMHPGVLVGCPASAASCCSWRQPRAALRLAFRDCAPALRRGRIPPRTCSAAPAAPGRARLRVTMAKTFSLWIPARNWF